MQCYPEKENKIAEVPPIVYEVLRSPGQPLDSATRSFMELQFGHNFSKVRVYADYLATRSARAVGAYAYTVGHKIVFDNDYFIPSTTNGRGLLAHELSHFLQQRTQSQIGDSSEYAVEMGNLQRAANLPLIAALAILNAVILCGLPFMLYATIKYEQKTDKWRHCWVSCEMSKTCGPKLAELAGLGREILDRAKAAYCDYYPTSWICQGGHGDLLDSLNDLVANQYCIPWETNFVGPLARLWRQSCQECCDASGL